MPWDSKDLDQRLRPEVVAVVGSRRADDYMWLRNMTDFKGKLYSVQVDPGDTEDIAKLGIPNYKSLAEIPDRVDYVVIAVPRRIAPAILKDAIAKGVKAVHIFTSGFAEAGNPEGAQLQQQITNMAREAGLLLIGPNCMGLYNPERGMRTGPGQGVDSVGSVAIISQSGGHNNSLIQAAQASGVGINKGVSFGNGVVLDSPDLLKYFGEDPNTNIICAYIEGPKDGRRFFQELREACRRKPVILWKGGQTEAGQRSASSHTGSLAGSTEVWGAVARQSGAIWVDSFEEAVDMMKALAYLAPTTGDGVGLIGGSGGQSVSMSDDFSRAGLRVPRLSDATIEAMSSFFQLVGASYYNPVDVGQMNRRNMESIIDLLAMDPNINALALMVRDLGGRRPREQVYAEFEMYQKAGIEAGKPVIAMFWTPIPYRGS
ncbi:MAG: CoA-binding protein, partial [Chloroflexota bacterium]